VAPVIVIEVLDERGQVRSRTRLTSFPATAGRGYDSHIMLDDPYVDARHLRFVEAADGRVVAEDAGSVNGTWLLGRRTAAADERVERAPLAPGTELRIGRTVLRVRLPDEPVPPALVDGTRSPAPSLAPPPPAARGRRLTPARVTAGVTAAAYAAFALSAYESTVDRAATPAVLFEPLAYVTLFALWAGVWALANRATWHRFNFAAHLAIVMAAGAVAMLLVEGVQWLEYLSPDTGVVSLVAIAAALALAAGLLAAHLSLASAAPRRRRWRRAVAVTATLAVVLGVIGVASDDEFDYELADPGELKPASGRWARTVDMGAFLAEAEKLRARTDSLVTVPARAPEADSAAAETAGASALPHEKKSRQRGHR